MLYDNKTGANVVQWPVEEIESLRQNSTVFEEVVVEPGSVVPLDIGVATQVILHTISLKLLVTLIWLLIF